MILSKLVVGVRKIVGEVAGSEPAALNPPGRFRNILERERARADRTGDEFSLVTFFPQEHESDRVAVARLVKILKRRLRSTDEIGWLDKRHVGVVLPGTPARGAWKVADDVCQCLPGNAPAPLVSVYCYPSDWHSGNGARPDPARRRSEHEGPVRAMEMLFFRPLPLWKRCLDVVGAMVGIVLLLPVFVAAAVAIKVSTRGPVFFVQQRSGLGGKRFPMVKFRSMVADAEAKKQELLALNEQDGPAFKIQADPRVTPVGRFLRRTSIDELPQLWNVLKGEMSLVGPRPLPCDEAEACSGWQRRRLDVTPGLTCIWQVRGRSAVSFGDWVRMDMQYIRSRSLAYDLKLLLQTVPAVVLRKGAC